MINKIVKIMQKIIRKIMQKDSVDLKFEVYVYNKYRDKRNDKIESK